MGRLRAECPEFQKYLAKAQSDGERLQQNFNHPNPKVRGGSRLLADLSFSTLCSEMTDEELAKNLIEKIWANTAIGTMEHSLVGEAIERIKGTK